MFPMINMRAAQVITGTTGDFREPVACLEVTNAAASAVTITLNSKTGQVPLAAIPVPANSTRFIPMKAVDFKASGSVTVVGYIL